MKKFSSDFTTHPINRGRKHPERYDENGRMLSSEVEAQEARFEKFIKTANLVKIGQKFIQFQANNVGNGMYNDYVYIIRVLRICADVEPCMMKPSMLNEPTWRNSYRDVLEGLALCAYIDSLTAAE